MINGVMIVVEKHISVFKRLFSDIVLIYKQMCKKSSIIFFIVIFLIYFLCPIGDFANRQYFFTDIFNNFTLYSYLTSIGVLFFVSLVHFLYLVNITNYFQGILFRDFFRENKWKLLRALVFIFLTFCIYFLFFKVFDYNNLKFSNLWLYIFLNYFKLFIIYITVAFGTLILIDLKSIREMLQQFTIKKFILKFIKVILVIAIIDLLLSPFFYCFEHNLFYLDRFSSERDLLTGVYYVLQCLINTVIVMFLYNFIELLVHNRNRELVNRKTFKKIILLSLAFVYLFVWFTCGVIYQSIARQSNGRDFIFQEDIKIKLQAKALKDLTNINVDEYTICDLIKNNELGKDSINFKKDNNRTTFTSSDNSSTNLNVVGNFEFNENEGTLCINEIGKYWGDFYSSDFYHRGISYYKFQVQNSIDAPSNIGLKSEKLYPVTIFLYSPKVKNTSFNPTQPNNIRLLGKNEDINNYSLVSQYTILIDDTSFLAKLKDGKGNSNDNNNSMYSNLTNMLQHSINFIDYDYNMINDNFNLIETNGIRYPLIDFLYYSAVTITTTGYGDILPNSTIIRTLVMFETFFGVGIPGFFISLLFFRVGHRENKM